MTSTRRAMAAEDFARTMAFLSDFADQAVILPIYAAVALALWLLHRRRDAAAWVVAIGATLGMMLMLKIAARDCAWVATSIDGRSPSGHTASAAAVYGGIVALLVRRRLASLATAAVMAALIGLTRISLGAHTRGEVVVGAIVGCAGAWAMLAGRAPDALTAAPPRRRIHMRVLLAVCVAATVIFHGHRLAAEDRIGRAAINVWPFSRCDAPAVP